MWASISWKLSGELPIILDRGYGRPPQSVEVFGADVQADTGDGVLEVIEGRLVELGERLRAQSYLPKPE